MLWQCPQCSLQVKLPANAFRVFCPCGYHGQFREAPIPLFTSKSEKSRLERQQRIAKAVAKEKRLIGWLTRFRLPTEIGVGDTAQRLILKACGYPKASKALQSLLNQCACERETAIANLNVKYPY